MAIAWRQCWSNRLENIGNILLGGMSGQPDRPQLAAPPFGSGNVPWGFEAQTNIG